jgi:SAM-dependent methyltransferase
MSEQITVYNSGFYEGFREGSRRSAQRVVPEVLSLLDVKSVVDVGCGVGTWLHAFRDCGVQDIQGVDGEYVDLTQLEVAADKFHPHDLRRPLRLDKQFDLVVSLEVAEHLAPEFASDFVESLTGLGPVVLFSAAIPFQNGTNHLNEQWPEYWVERFATRGYVPVDCIRPRVWGNPDVEPWYAQNTLLFVKEDRLQDYPKLAAARAAMSGGSLSMVHPRIYLNARRDAQQGMIRSSQLDQVPLRRILTSLPTRVLGALTGRLLHRPPNGTATQPPAENAAAPLPTGSAKLAAPSESRT